MIIIIIFLVKVLQRYVLSYAITNCEIASSKHSTDRKRLAGKHPCSHHGGISLVIPRDYKMISSLTNISVAGIKYACQWCGRNFSWPSSLRLHQKMACGKPPNFCCTVCDYKSNFKGNLKRHLFCKHNIDLYWHTRD